MRKRDDGLEQWGFSILSITYCIHTFMYSNNYDDIIDYNERFNSIHLVVITK